MERYRKIEQKPEENYIIISVNMLEKFIQHEEFSNLVTLYFYYLKLSCDQGSSAIIITNQTTAKQIHWNKDKVSKIRRLLKNIGVIEDFYKRGSDGKLYYHGLKIHNPQFEENLIPLDQGFQNRNIIIFAKANNNILFFNRKEYTSYIRKAIEHIAPNSVENNQSLFNDIELDSPKNKITSSMFNKFWKLYPKKTYKAAAKKIWDKICSLKSNDPNRPTWEQIETSLSRWKKSKQWEYPIFITKATKFLEEAFWDEFPNDGYFEKIHQKEIETERLAEEQRREQEQDEIRQRMEMEERLKRYNKKYDDPNLY